MQRRLPLIALLLVGGCATTPGPVEVTRFATGAVVARAAVVAAPGSAPTLEQKSYEDAVGRALARLGFAGDGPARYTFSVDVSRDSRAALRRRSPVTIGIGGGTGGYGSGVGLGASFGLGGNRARDTVVTRLSVQLRERATSRVVWEGRAQGETTENGGASIDHLAAALFRDFPGESGRTISVP